MTIYRIVNTCELFGSQYDAGGYVGLDEEQEKELMLGKYAKEVPDAQALRRDPSSKKTVKIGNKNLVKAKNSEISGQEGKPIDDGFISYPPAKNPVQQGMSRGDTHATQFQTVR